MAGDLIDLWLYEGQKGLNFVKATQAYQLTDQYVHYGEIYEQVKSRSQALATSVKSTVSGGLESLNQKVVFFYDEASSFVGMLINVLSSRQSELAEYIRRTYSNVSVFMHDNWMRLDFNRDGAVSAEDLRKNLTEFYRFLVNYHYVEETLRISSSLYDEAKKRIRQSQESKPAEQAPAEKEPVQEAEPKESQPHKAEDKQKTD